MIARLRNSVFSLETRKRTKPRIHEQASHPGLNASAEGENGGRRELRHAVQTYARTDGRRFCAVLHRVVSKRDFPGRELSRRGAVPPALLPDTRRTVLGRGACVGRDRGAAGAGWGPAWRNLVLHAGCEFGEGRAVAPAAAAPRRGAAPAALQALRWGVESTAQAGGDCGGSNVAAACGSDRLAIRRSALRGRLSPSRSGGRPSGGRLTGAGEGAVRRKRFGTARQVARGGAVSQGERHRHTRGRGGAGARAARHGGAGPGGLDQAGVCVCVGGGRCRGTRERADGPPPGSKGRFRRRACTPTSRAPRMAPRVRARRAVRGGGEAAAVEHRLAWESRWGVLARGGRRVCAGGRGVCGLTRGGPRG